jgi:peptidoglycan/xylan/chitin deacetylase (PgdA/CDA1 family)
MSTKHKLSLLSKNPLFIIPPLVLLLSIGWHQYTFAGRNLNLPQGTNLMPDGFFSVFGSNNIPKGWEINNSGIMQYTTAPTSGYAGGRALNITTSNYQSGDLTLTSPIVPVMPGQTYLFKGYYSATVSFSLVERVYHSDGTSTSTLIQTYQQTGSNWSTASDAFHAAKNVQSVQYIFNLFGNGHLDMNSFYLESQQHEYIAPALVGVNTIPNGELAQTGDNTPTDWTTYNSGSSEDSFSYLQDEAGPYLQTQITGFKSGEAKWQYLPQVVQPSQAYQISVTYRSDTTVPITAEFVLTNGNREYQTIATLPPIDQWTNTVNKFEVPVDATNMFISLPLQHNGTVSTRNYQLINITKPVTKNWPGPMVSITFDSGRQSQYDNAEPILQQDGLKATFYINPSTIETRGFMNANDIITLADTGNEIGTRGYNPDDMTAIDENSLDYQLHEGRDYLRSGGFQVSDFAEPYGRSDAEVQYYARQYFSTVRSTDTGINTWQNLDPYDLKVLNVSSATTKDTLGTMLATAKAERGWLILVYQGVGDTTSPTTPSGNLQTNVSVDAFKEQIGIIQKSGIPVRTIITAFTNIPKQ